MKKTIAIIAAALAMALAFTSCDAILEQESPSTFNDATIFSNAGLAEGTIFAITQSFGETNCYRGRYLPWYGFNTDIEWYNTYKPGDGKSDIAAYDMLPNNSQMNLANGPYVKMYEAVERANLAIEGLRQYGKIEDNSDTAYLLGEALTLRALIYYDLIKAWGDVPARFESVNSESIYVKKESRDVIFKQILADLEEAFGYLPYPGKTAATSRTDRINKVFAEGLYARIALAASGYALRPDDGKVGTGDLGTVRLSNDPELQKSVLYPKALNYLKDAITSGTCSLQSDYEKMWKDMACLDNLTAGPGHETLYVIPFSNGRGRWNFTFAVSNAGYNILGYTYNQGGQTGPTPNFFFKYDNDDIRRDLTCVNFQWNKNGPEPSGISKWCFGKYRFEWMTASPYTGGNDDGVKPVVMRYSDILLMAAEIENELNGPTALAKSFFTEVRARAFKGHEDKAEAYVAGLQSKEAFFNAIVDERAFEFCGEFLRKGDLIRWNLLKTKMDEAVADMKKLRDLAAPYDYLNGDIWWQEKEDGSGITIYGLKPGETGTPAGNWEKEAGYVTKYDDAKSTGFYTKRIEGIYYKDPDTRQFWPLFNDQITNSQGNLVNDYGY